MTICADGGFEKHISNVATSANQKCAWILRTFRTRDRFPLLILWKSLVRPIVDYCSQLWCPTAPGQINTIEKVQVNFFKKIIGMQDLDYWEQLKDLKVTSLQRRRERYICIYMWKILENIVPNFGVEVIDNERTGRYCRIPTIRSTVPHRINNLRFKSMAVNGPRIFNSLPRNLRNMSSCSVDSFKGSLDKYLSVIPDEPRVQGLTKYCS